MTPEVLKTRSYGLTMLYVGIIMTAIRNVDYLDVKSINEMNRLRMMLNAHDEQLRGFMKKSGHNFRLDPDNRLYEKS